MNQEQIRIRPSPAEVAQVAEKRVIQSYEPEFQEFDNQYNKYQSEPEPVRQSQQQSPVYQRQSPVRQVADKRQDNDLSESVARPQHQTDLEASVQAAAAGYPGGVRSGLKE